MLREIHYVKQERKKDKRRWFTDEEWDLYVWNRKDGSWSGFQLCYGKTTSQRALTWMDGTSPAHTGVHEENVPGKPRSEWLVADGTLDVSNVIDRFSAESQDIDPEVRDYVLGKLRELGDGNAPTER